VKGCVGGGGGGVSGKYINSIRTRVQMRLAITWPFVRVKSMSRCYYVRRP